MRRATVRSRASVRWAPAVRLFQPGVSDFRRALAAGRHLIMGALPILAPYAVSPARSDTSTAERSWTIARASSRPMRHDVLTALSSGRQLVRGDTIQVRTTSYRSGLTTAADVGGDPFIQRDAAPIVEFSRLVPDLGGGAPLDGAGLAQAERIIAAGRHGTTVETDTSAGDAIGTLRAGRGGPTIADASRPPGNRHRARYASDSSKPADASTRGGDGLPTSRDGWRRSGVGRPGPERNDSTGFAARVTRRLCRPWRRR